MDNGGQNIKVYTINEAAELIGESAVTVRRKIKKGEYKAELLDGDRGPTYFIKQDEINRILEGKRTVIIEVPVVQEPSETAQIDFFLNRLTEHITEAQKPLLEEIRALKAHIEKTEEQMAAAAEKERRKENERDQHLMKLIREVQEMRMEQAQSWWQKWRKKKWRKK
jgi:hypothetical protein